MDTRQVRARELQVADLDALAGEEQLLSRLGAKKNAQPLRALGAKLVCSTFYLTETTNPLCKRSKNQLLVIPASKTDSRTFYRSRQNHVAC